jgi:hypothetical protein
MDRITHAGGKDVARWINDYRKDSVVPYHFDRASWTHLNFRSRPSLSGMTQMWLPNVTREILNRNGFATSFPPTVELGRLLLSFDTMGIPEMGRDGLARNPDTTSLRGTLINPLTRRRRSA